MSRASPRARVEDGHRRGVRNRASRQPRPAGPAVRGGHERVRAGSGGGALVAPRDTRFASRFRQCLRPACDREPATHRELCVR
ncbi:hypothetical protein FRACA_160029 [Frankia canadensis]|uniref:Uncharacterized protein n=1 Tax=Frankia canadensis TaxID=1836972 RepID=A0A2I2KMI7_9ACTN|nr:hypothetical protein FRACA_160029 [Frankia canadensis]SOU54168.1 hypothetical protein FRACA_160029 [Frankia canadensis]